MVATKDIADAATRLLLGGTFTEHPVRYLLGPRDLTMSEATRILGDAIGNPGLKYVQFPEEEARKAMLGMGMSRSVVEAMLEMDPPHAGTELAEHDADDLGGVREYRIRTRVQGRGVNPGEENPMKMLLQVRIPHEEFNAAVRDGSAGKKLNRILEETRPEAVYFTEQNGQRGAIMIVDLADPSKVPAFAEPWFLTFKADVEFRVVMTPEDLKKAGLDELGKKWR
jgi:hypothetical protein